MTAVVACVLFIAEMVVLFVTRKSDSGAVLLVAGSLWVAGLILLVVATTGAVV